MKNIHIQNCIFRYDPCVIKGIFLNVSIEITTIRNSESNKMTTCNTPYIPLFS